MGRIYASIGILTALLVIALGPAAAGAGAAAMQRLPGCSANELAENDDGSTSEVPLGFSANFEGATYTGVYVNNNGNVTFGSPLSVFTPEPIGSFGVPIIAPFWADVDTRTGGNTVTYGTTTYAGQPAFCVEWDDVGYYDEHFDKLNQFELILVSRPDRGAGEFDVVFNYDKIQWETGDASGGSEGFGGTAPRVGFGLGGGGSSEVSGSGTNGAFLDGGPAALASGNAASGVPGRYIFPVIAGQPQGEPGLHGLVSSHNAALIGASVQACPDAEPAFPCHVTQTDGQGRYSFTSLPEGLWRVTVNPPSGDPIDLPTTVGPVQITGDLPVNLDVVMSTLTPPPSGTEVGGIGTFGGGQPILNWNESTPIATNGCVGATSAHYEVVVPANSPSGEPSVVQEGGLTEGPSGVYRGAIAPLAPFHGFAQIKFTLNCPAPSAPEIGSFDIYVDPSGHVVDTSGAGISGATVTLLRADDAGGPYTPVADGSSIMAPNNRSNPSTTDSAGRFGWDVLAGFYKVTASKPGCVNPANHAEDSVSTGVLTVPPPVTDVSLTLDCNPSNPVSIGKLEGLRARALKNGSIKVTVKASGAGSIGAKAQTRIKLSQRKQVRGKKGHMHGKRGTASKRRQGSGRHRTKWVGYGRGGATLTAAGEATFIVHPSKRAKTLLKRRGRLKVPVTALFKPSPAGDPSSKTVGVTVHYAPRHKKHGHHARGRRHGH